MAARQGFEPRQTEPKSAVLPLHHQATEKTLQFFSPASSFLFTEMQGFNTQVSKRFISACNSARVRIGWLIQGAYYPKVFPPQLTQIEDTHFAAHFRQDTVCPELGCLGACF